MKKKEQPAELTPSEREETIRLKAENEYLRAENAVIKRYSLERRKMGSATQGEKALLIKELREEGHPLKYLLKVIGMARSTYFYELRKTDAVQERNADVGTEIQAIFAQKKGRYGVRRVHAELVNRGYTVNHKRVQRLMHKMSLLGKRPKEKYYSYKGEVGCAAANLIDRDFSTTAPMEKRTTDVSQFNFPWGENATSRRYWT